MSNLLDQGVALAEAGRLSEAIAPFRQALGILTADDGGATHLAAWRNLGHVLSGLGQSAEAAHAYNRALPLARASGDDDLFDELSTECAAAHIVVAQEHQKANEESMTLALRSAWHALPADEQIRQAYAASLHTLGVTYQREGRHRMEEAVAVTRASLVLSPRSAPAYLNLGLLCSQWARRADEPQLARQLGADALSAYASAMRVDPTSGEAHYHWANALRSAGRERDALRAYAEGVIASPSHVGLRASFGYALIANGADATESGGAHGNVARGVRVLREPWRGGKGPRSRSGNHQMWAALAAWQTPAGPVPGLPSARPFV